MKTPARIVTMAAVLALAALASSPFAAAQPLTVARYQHPKSPKDLVFNKAYMIGVADGLIAYNMSADNKLFCMQGVIPHISFERANDIVMRWARTADDAPDMPLGRALLFGLRKAYPCH